MRYSLLAVAVSCTLVLTACNKSTDTAESAAQSDTSAATVAETTSTATTSPASDFKSAENIAMNITGAGASFPQPIYAKWSYDYNAATGGQVNYQSIGSSGGIKQIQAK